MTAAATFVYVDTAVGGTSHRNHVMPLARFRPRSTATDCYTTYLRYDAGLPAWVAAHAGSVKDYRGPCWTVVVPFDLDHKHDLAVALADLRRLLYWLHDRWDVPLEAVAILFSGSKGFHLELPAALFGGFEPATTLPEQLAALVRDLVAGVAVSCLDWSIYQPLRLWRWPNTRHGTTGLHAVPLTAAEALTLPLPQIVALAAAPRTVVRPEPDDWTARPELVALWQTVTSRAARARPAEHTGARDGGPPAALAPILAGCAWLRHTRDAAATLPEPDWYAMLSILGRCEHGARLAHTWSAPHPDYSPDETAAKLTRALTDAGPATCGFIRDALEAPACRTCPHQDCLTSPIVLGRPRRRLASATPMRSAS